MKFSYLCANTYGDPSVVGQAKFPYPPAMYVREVGARSVEAALAQAKVAEDLGYDWVSVSEHHYGPAIMEPNAMVFAGALTQVLKRAKIAVLGPLASINNPIRLAEEIALLDLMSVGRLVVAPLRGTPNESDTYYFNAYETRERTQEATQLILRALTEPQPFGWQGRYFCYPTISVWPRAAQVPHPPFYYSGNSPESCVFAAQNHLGMAMSFIPPHFVAEAVALYKSECAKEGWTPTQDQVIYRCFVIIAETEEEVEAQRELRIRRRTAGRNTPKGLSAESWTERAPGGNGKQGTIGPDGDSAARGGEGYALGSIQFCGTPGTVVEQIKRFHEQTGVGVLDMLFSDSGGPEGLETCIRLFGTEVLPYVHDLGDPSVVNDVARRG